MKAIVFHEFGDPNVLKLEDVPQPTPHADEILVKVHHAGVSPFDLHVREGWYKESNAYPLPCVLGWELSGEIVAIGSNVKHFKVGNSVLAHPSVYRNGGAYAEYAVVKASEAALKPNGVPHADAAAAAMNALTAWQALFDSAKLQKDQRVLIHAAAGGVGHIAVQLAKWRGAYVIGIASAKNEAFLHSLGTDEVIDYNTTAFENVISDLDVVLDTVGGSTLLKSFPLIKAGGIVVSLVDFANIKRASEFNIEGKAIVVEPNAEQLASITKLMADGVLKIQIAAHFPLIQARQAHELCATGHVRGKIVLDILC